MAKSSPADGGWLLLRRPLLLGLVLGAFVSFTTTGRLTLRLLLDGLVFWSFVPAINVAAAGLLATTSAGRLTISRSTDLLFSTFGPWLCWLLGLAGAAAFGPDAATSWSSRTAWITVSFVVALTWSGFIQYRFLLIVAGAGWRRSLLLLGVLKLVVWGPPIVFFALSDQLEPRLLQMLEMG